MSEIQEARGGDGWSTWVVDRERSGGYFVAVTSSAETNSDGSPKVLHVSDVIRDGRRAIDQAISVSSAYAHRMAS